MRWGNVSGAHINPAVTLRILGRPAHSAPRGRRVHRCPVRRCSQREPGLCGRWSPPTRLGGTPAERFRGAVLRVGAGPHAHPDVRHPERLNRLEGAGDHGRRGRRSGGGSGGALRGADLRRFDEPGAFPGPRRCRLPPRRALDILDRSRDRR